MGRLIDADVLIQYWLTSPMSVGWDDEIEDVNNQPTVEAIPKDQYEARLKADLEAILVELQLEIENHGIVDFEETYVDDGECIISVSECNRLIQQKINEIKGE